MMNFKLKLTCFIVLSLLSTILLAQSPEGNRRTLIVMFDGLRPDYITAENMPNLHALKQKGAYGNANHSVFPTVTRVNSASYATGSYPQKHGLLGNTVYFPQVNKTKGLNTGDASELMKIADATHGNLLLSQSLGEILQANGKKLMVFSSGSTGQAYLQNHKISGGAIINPELILPEELKEKVTTELGVPPAYAKPNTGRHKWVTDALIKFGLSEQGPSVIAVWFSDPDGTAHAEGLGSPKAIEAIKVVDAEFGRILNEIESKGWSDNFDIIVSTDHGFVTDVGTETLSDFLIKQGFKKDKESDDVVLAGGAIYVKGNDSKVIARIVTTLQGQEWIGAIFTKSRKAGDVKGSVEGTLSFESIHWNNVGRVPDILVAENWDDRKNQWGYAGTSFSKGVAGHGGSSPYEIHIPLIASGAGFKKQFVSELPTSNVDITPTVLFLQGIKLPTGFDGRVLTELLDKKDQVSELKSKKETIETSVKHDWGVYKLVLERTQLGEHKYIDYTKVIRTMKTAKAK
jgi:predicted AlkP superfamily pyrophosphatase or phosphodiesterase